MSFSSGSAGSATRRPPGNQEPRISCITCKKRKVKCDKNSPCGNCARKHIDCTYVTVSKRKTRGPGKHRAGERIEQMTTRVAQLEQVLGQLKARGVREDLALEIDIPSTSSASASVCEPGRRDDRSAKMDSLPTPRDEELNDMAPSAPRLLVKEGKSECIRNKYWATMNDEVHSLPRPSTEQWLTFYLACRIGIPIK